MPTKKSMKRSCHQRNNTVQSAKRKVQSQVQNAERKVQSAERKLANATIDAQFAFLESQIALLQAQNAELNAKLSCEQVATSAKTVAADAITNVASNEQSPADNFRLPTNNSQLATHNSQLRIGPNPLPAPTLVIMSVSSNSILVDWDKVTNATGYLIEVAKNDSTFTNPVTLNADAAATSLNIDGLNANTTYYIRVMATGTGVNGNSAFSNVQSIKTLGNGTNGMDDGIVGNLQSWLAEQQTEFQNITAIVPQLTDIELNAADRRRLNGSGVRRYGFIEKTADIAADFPQVWPGLVDDNGKLKELVGEIEVLRNLLIWFRYVSRAVQDLLLIAGDDAFRLAGSYYAAARDGARRKNPEAAAVYEMLKSFWRKRRRIMDEPTEMEMLRDAKALLRGSKSPMPKRCFSC